MNFLNRIIATAIQQPKAVAITVRNEKGSVEKSYSYEQIINAAYVLAGQLISRQLKTRDVLTVGVLAGNSAAWVVADLALLLAGICEVPIPLMFTKETAINLLSATNFYVYDKEGEARLAQWGDDCSDDSSIGINVDALVEAGNRRAADNAKVSFSEDWVCKIIHTSGTTSLPKGVKIRYEGLDILLDSLTKRTEKTHHSRCMSLVPLSLLIEQVSAVYMTLMHGGEIAFSAPGLGLLGEKSIRSEDYLARIKNFQPSTLTLTPALVDALSLKAKAASVQGKNVIETLFGTQNIPFLACGGAPTNIDNLKLLASMGIRVFEGYGLSENSSVVSWNYAAKQKIGSVGRPLDHVNVTTNEDGELLVKSGSIFAGYTQKDPSACDLTDDGWLKTGDIARIDDEGFIFIKGRKKHVIITANGRNLSPEWVETRFSTVSDVKRCVIFGDGLEDVHCLIVMDSTCVDSEVLTAVRQFSEEYLSDIERPDFFHLMNVDEVEVADLWTITGRPRRQAIQEHLLSSAIA